MYGDVVVNAEPGHRLFVRFAGTSGDCSERDPPLPIPVTEVKPLSPDGTDVRVCGRIESCQD
jgi:hypothetical protein